MPAIRFQNFSFRYSGAKQPTLKNITLTIEKGEKVLIAGPSGSGKSTLAHCINGLILASAGEYTGFYQLLEQSPAGQNLSAISEQVGTVLQDQDAQFVGLSVGEDVAFADENRNVPLPQMQANVQRALTAVAMLDQIATPPAQLSGGQKQRVSLAGLLTTPGETLLLDEPLANLDPQSSRTALELIAQINQTQHKTVIIIEHRIEEVIASGVNRLIIMNNGEIVAAGPPEQLLTTDLLIRNGLREPSYIAFLKTAGIRFSDADSLTQLGGLGKYKTAVKSWFHQQPAVSHNPPAHPLLKVEKLAFTYGKALPNTLRNISFELHRGELMTILGNNGAGKSTLLKVLTGMEQHQQGAIYLKGERIDRWSILQRAAKIGYVMQNPNQMITQHLIFDEVAFGLRNQGLNAHSVEERVRAALKICDLDPFRNWPVNAVSYGQRKRVTIAAILALRPEVLILDEPSAGQDYRSYLELMRFLTGLTSEGYSIIIITHDLQLALEYADRALVLSAGQIIAADRAAAILTQPAVMQQANLTQPSLAALAPLWGIADAAGLLEAFGAQRQKGETA